MMFSPAIRRQSHRASSIVKAAVQTGHNLEVKAVELLCGELRGFNCAVQSSGVRVNQFLLTRRASSATCILVLGCTELRLFGTRLGNVGRRTF